MKRDFSKMDVDRLVEEFMEVTLGQYEANLVDDASKFNRLFLLMEEIEKELKRRPGDQRHALLPLCGHQNVQVRLRAAIAVLALAPGLARQTLEEIKEINDFPATANAFGMLRALDQGRYVPD